ncbi:MAG: alpha/beta hydrolase [Flavobacterium circumlabens]|uniref:Alpha/beta hydrolase n=1 Tax=Flavobacterium circumlabens TaxID=2133765 RepID=A0A4Y7UFK0_9FLAO|nr:alpha/beta hydrolase [Flavobacterium circumlabens]TCN60005.1 pimeloyl-ACP methyl ester carboxylesterase [Flavobacterium circumlabens]TEB45243.1 alpha/beta hydrolase [Flavobacterium circumlabens]
MKYSICAVILLTTIFTACNNETKTAEATTDTSEKQTETRAEYIEVAPNVKLHVTDLGEGKPVVLIHGYPLSDASWEYQYHALVKAGYRVIGITLRGFGQSDKPYGKYNYDQFAADIKVVLDKLDIKDATLGGHSMGGAIALHYVAKYNSAHVGKLALFSAAAPCHTKKPDYPYPFFTKEDITQWVELNNSDRPALLAAVGERFTLSATSLSPGIGAWLGGIEMQSSAYAMEQALIALRDEDLRGDLPKIKIPTLILHAKEDKIVSFALAEQMNKAIAGSQLVPFDKSGHASFIEEKDKFNQEFIKFIKQ